MLDAHQINIFLVAAETLNFTQAAERLHMSQPSISQHIRSLEEHFGETLFIRQGRSLILSDAGRMLIPLAQQFVKQSTCIDEAMASLKGHIRGRISVGCDALSGKYFLPEYFTKFHQLYPEVSISCQTDLCDGPLQSLRKGDVHFLVTYQGQVFEPCFQVKDLLLDEIVLIAHPDHPWTKRGQIDPEDLLEEIFILPSDNNDTYTRITSSLSDLNISLEQLNSFLTLCSTEAIILSVEKGLGLSFSSRITASTIGNVAIIPIQGFSAQIGICLVRDQSQLTTAARDAFWDYMSTAGEEIQQNLFSA